MVSQFPLDVMHLVDLGVLKQVLVGVTTRPCVGGPNRKVEVDKMSQIYESYKAFTPKDCYRRQRPLTEVPRFKASEFRQFGL